MCTLLIDNTLSILHKAVTFVVSFATFMSTTPEIFVLQTSIFCMCIYALWKSTLIILTMSCIFIQQLLLLSFAICISIIHQNVLKL